MTWPSLVVAHLAVEEGTPGTDTGVVVDLLDHTEVLGNRVRVGPERDGVADVQQLSMHARTECRDLVGRLPQPMGSTSDTAMRASRRASSKATARPMPEPAPGITATLPLTELIVVCAPVLGDCDDTLGFLAPAFYAVASAEPMRMTGTLRSTE